MERSLEQRYAIKFCVRLGKNATETFQMLQKAFKDDCISRSQSGKCHKAFKEGREEVADEPRSGRPTTARTEENVDRVLEVLRTDRRLSIQKIADTLHVSTFVVHGIVTEDLQMRKVCEKLVPKVLTQDQKKLRVLRCQELLDLIQNEPDFLNSVVTGDKSWMFEYDPESKRQSCASHTKSSPRPKKARMSKSRIKMMIIVFFNIRGIVHLRVVQAMIMMVGRSRRLLLIFRTYPVAITADIEKMYRQIRIHPEDADYQRILWRPSPEEPVVDYRLLTVTYGTTSAPFLAMRTLQQLAEDEGQNYPEASRVTLNDFYVDDLLTGAQTIAETKELIDQLKDLMKKGGFHLRKWNSNCHEIVSHVEEMNEERKINLEKGAISKILGIVWDHVQDTFKVNITLPEEVVTKRDLLSNIARIFDPIGFLSPTTVAMANLQRQTAVKEVEDLEGLPVYHRAILKENGEWPEVTKAIQCSYPKVFVGDGTYLYLLIEDVESLDGPNVRSVLYQYHIPHKKWIWRKVIGFAPIVISKSIVYASHDKRVYFVGGRIHSRGNKVTCTDNIVRVKLKEGRASVLVKSRESPLTDLLVLAMTFAPSAFLFMLAETRDHSTYKVFSYHLLNKDWHLIGSDKIFWKEKFLCLQICYTNKKLLLFPRMQWEQHFCNLYNYRLQTDSWGCYTTIPILGEKEGYPKNINHFTIVQDWVRAVFVHAGKESKYLWKLNLKSKQWTELPTYVKYRDRQYTAVALDLVFILGPADKEHKTAEKYLSFFKTRKCELLKFGLLPESTYDLLRSWLRFPSNLNQGSAAGGSMFQP
ncbi:hypothetical protein LAZ67_9001136 [Cordylochernes scorpioides]|uniref:Uncharacterized protein n=1 Tax=Cordylochernes scorpioides TaxID=51811 RepID=A0ABY6KTA4_9ARAC|nr:hypothetical protein LAZ67_9001136 [Cordylochernes scorpioides]